MKTKQSVLFFLTLVFLIPIRSLSQQTSSYTDPENAYKTALELFDKEKFGPAQHLFLKIRDDRRNTNAGIGNNSEYYAAVCGLELFNKDAEALMLRFIGNNPESPQTHIAWFRLGKFYYTQKQYKNASRAFEKTDISYLGNTDAAEYYFKLGYSYFNTGDFAKAGKAFYEVKGTDSKYAAPAMFYYAHGEYQDKHYETALQSFLKLKNAEAFAQAIPYYITQIYYLQGKYDSLVAYAPPLLEKANPQNGAEISHLIGDAYYRKSNYKDAIPYLETYRKNAPKITREDYYQLGFSLYKSNEYDRAVQNFEKITDVKDSIAQNALFILADCFLKSDRKTNARNAFLLASEMDFDKKVKEEALYDYAALSAELGFQPDAINAFQGYLKKYASSARKDEINELLSGLFLMTKNYKDALEALENIKSRNEKIKRAYQRVAFYRAIELYTNGTLPEASEYFEKSLGYPVDPVLASEAIYWKAEISYKKRDYDNASRQYLEFIYHPGAANSDLFRLVNYNTGYCYFKKDDYPNALTWFRKYAAGESAAEKNKLDDALLRIADCSFVLRDYPNALAGYSAAISRKAASADYGMFQKGIIEGVQGRIAEKIATMEQLPERYPNSPYVDDALFEAANSYLIQGENLQALNLFDEIVSKYPSSSYVKKSLLGTALLYYNERRDEKAKNVYMQIISTYPASPEAHEALVGIKNIYVNAGDPEGYMKYANQLSFGNVSENSQDSITYEAAEMRYMKEDCENAARSFESYIARFKNGYFLLNANFYKAECEFKAANYDKALEGYTFVISQPKNTFTEKSLLKAARINFLQKKYDRSLENYAKLEQVSEYKANILEAYIGQMRSALLLGKFDLAGENARKVLGGEKVPEEMLDEAHLNFAVYLMTKDSLDHAMKEFEIVAKAQNTDKGAEAKYNMSGILHRQGKFREAEKSVFELINNFSSDYWIAKGYILLGDNYLAQGDAFQAKATYKSITDNYEGADLKEIARKKLDEVLAKEAAQKEAETREKEKAAESKEQIIDVEPKNPQ